MKQFATAFALLAASALAGRNPNYIVVSYENGGDAYDLALHLDNDASIKLPRRSADVEGCTGW